MTRLPEWLRRPLAPGSTLKTHEVLETYRLNTVCESALCPNRSECYAQKTATFMILGNVCTRSCGFCAIDVGRPQVLEADEPQRVAQAALELRLAHVVVTSVARDDLADEGASHFAETILAVRSLIPTATIEVLTPDFHARRELIERVCDARPDVFNHNLETIKRLTKRVRRQAKYTRSLEVLGHVKTYAPEISTKSGLMLGLGETINEVVEALQDLKRAGVDIVTIGQYLKPAEGNLDVEAFVHPEQFAYLEEEGRKMGFKEVFSGPYVRSSYHAGETFAHSQVEVGGTVRA